MLTGLGLKEAEMRLIGCDLHASQQSIAMLDRDTGAVIEKTLKHEGAAPIERTQVQLAAGSSATDQGNSK